MSNKPVRNNFLRGVAIVLLSLTAIFTLAGGIGTSCVALDAAKYGPSFAKMAPVQPILQILCVISILSGIFGVYSIIRLAKNKPRGYMYTLIFLVVAGAASAVQFYLSSTLRGSTAPNNFRLYVTVFTLLVMLALRLPGLWSKVGFEGSGKSGGTAAAGGVALFLCGLVTISMPVWGEPTHLVGGFNTVNVLLIPLLAAGAVMMVAGGILVGRGFSRAQPRELVEEKAIL